MSIISNISIVLINKIETEVSIKKLIVQKEIVIQYESLLNFVCKQLLNLTNLEDNHDKLRISFTDIILNIIDSIKNKEILNKTLKKYDQYIIP